MIYWSGIFIACVCISVCVYYCLYVSLCVLFCVHCCTCVIVYVSNCWFIYVIVCMNICGCHGLCALWLVLLCILCISALMYLTVWLCCCSYYHHLCISLLVCLIFCVLFRHGSTSDHRKLRMNRSRLPLLLWKSIAFCIFYLPFINYICRDIQQNFWRKTSQVTSSD